MTHHDRVALPNSPVPHGYLDLLDDIKREIAGARLRTAVAVNTEMITLYWRIGRHILSRQSDEGWGAKVVQRLSVDLKLEYPQIKGLSPTNLRYMRAFAAGWPEIFQQPVGRIPWGHITVLLDRIQDPHVRDFYACRVAEEGWSRGFLIDRIKARLHERVGVAPTTFARTIPIEEQESVQHLAKDPWLLDFLDGNEEHTERELEARILANITRFLQELGEGFAFMGRQYCLLVDGQEFFVDLLFYNVKLRRFIVIELKVGKFLPEHVGKLNFYLSVIDDQLRDPEHDRPTIGILLVAERSDVVVEFSLNRVDSPLAVGGYDYGTLPPDVRAALPSKDQLAGAMAKVLDEGGANQPDELGDEVIYPT
jgi:predicted nuclease of restriction endonuclease-like (RecB) superfamily